MSTKLKVLGLGLLAVMVTSVFAVNASATIGGHFTNDAANGHAIITGTEATGTTHRLAFVRLWGSEEEEITCHKASYAGTVSASTVQSVTLAPAWDNCTTGTTGTGTTFPIHENGCVLTITSGNLATPHHTVDVACPKDKAIEITHENCTIRIPPQTVGGGALNGGVTNTTTVENFKHALTADVTATEVISYYETGICIFLGTLQKLELKGSLTIKATNTEGMSVNLTDTG